MSTTSTPHKGTVQVISPHLFDEKLKDEKKYWLHHLSGKPVVTGLPLDYARPAKASSLVRALSLNFEGALHERLVKLCGGRQPLMFAVLVAAVKIVLHKYTGADDILVGTTVHNLHADVSTLNRVLAIRDQVNSSHTVKQFLMQVKETLAGAYANQKYSFQRILELLEIEDTPNRQPLFNISVTLRGTNDAEHRKELKTDVNIIFTIGPEETSSIIEYREGLFTPSTISLFGDHISETLRGVLRNSDAQIKDLNLLSADKRDALVRVANQTAVPYDLDRTIHSLFLEQVAATPNAAAVECRGEVLTFEQLNQKANQLAHYLQRIGVKRGNKVGIYLEHSIDLVISILGVINAGAAYVPLDPVHPVGRTALVLNDAQIKVVLTHTPLAGRINHDITTVCLDSEPAISLEPDHAPAVAARAADVAYVIYTSGSTGEPRGVEIQHRSLVNYILWAGDTYLRGERLAFPLYSSVAFDLTVTSIFTPLVTGNLMLIYPEGGLEHPLLDVLRENRVGVLKLTPSHLGIIRDRKMKADQIKRVIVGGEAFTTELALESSALFADSVEIFNEYGPTEATVGCMIHLFRAETDRRAFVPIGVAAPNSQIYILDEHLHPVAENVLGQVFIGGEGLALGYLNRPRLTRERFIESPFEVGARIYETGDLARWLPEGLIEYGGRKDDQIKFQGHRVELNEIRVALNGHPFVNDNAILVVKENGHDVMMAHYASDQQIEPMELRKFLADRIIECTIPSVFSWLPELPLTANGKVDHRALPSLEKVRLSSRSRICVAPRTPTEELLMSIWVHVLGRDGISVHDDFFELGGHSLLAHQIISRTRATFQIDVPLRTLFESTTIGQLGAVVDRLAREKSGLGAPPIRIADRSRSLPLSFSQQRVWFVEQIGSQHASYNIYPYFQLNGPLNVAALQQSINEIIRRHESLRTAFRLDQAQPVQVIEPALKIEIPLVDLAALSEAERSLAVQRVTEDEIAQPFDLANGPLIRARLLRLAHEEHLLCLAMHHIVFDAWSLDVFYRELTVIYKSLVTRSAPSLPELTVQYADYSAWQREWLQSEVLRNRVAYWRKQLAGMPPLLDLLPERARPETLSDSGAHQNILLSADVSERITAISRGQGCTVFMTLLTAFKVLLSFYTGKKDIVVGSDIANRERAEVENLIGFFVNTLVLRTDLSGDPSFLTLLGRAREVCLDAYAHQDLPFEKLVEELNPSRSNSQSPLFQVMFGFVPDNPIAKLDLQGLDIKFVPPDNRSSVFDFTLYMTRTANGLAGSVRYKTDLYDAAFASQFLADLELLLAHISAQPELSISKLHAVLSEVRQQTLLARQKDLKDLRKEKFQKLKRTVQAAQA